MTNILHCNNIIFSSIDVTCIFPKSLQIWEGTTASCPLEIRSIEESFFLRFPYIYRLNVSVNLEICFLFNNFNATSVKPRTRFQIDAARCTIK